MWGCISDLALLRYSVSFTVILQAYSNMYTYIGFPPLSFYKITKTGSHSTYYFAASVFFCLVNHNHACSSSHRTLSMALCYALLLNIFDLLNSCLTCVFLPYFFTITKLLLFVEDQSPELDSWVKGM